MQCMYLAVFCFLAVALHTAGALRCWSCDSRNNRYCGDPFNKTLHRLSDCERDRSLNTYNQYINFVCKKYKYMYNGEEVVMRSCTTDSQSACKSNTHLADKETFCETCTEEGCNGAMRQTTSFAILLPAIFWALGAKFL